MMPVTSDQFALDPGSLERLRRTSEADPTAGVKAASQQFEAVFLNMMLKSMREASPEGGLFDNEQTRMYQSMLDQQLTQTLSSAQGGATGLAAVIERQLSQGMSSQAASLSAPASIKPPASSANPVVNMAARQPHLLSAMLLV